MDEFVERFAAFAWERSLVLPAATALPIGTQGRFVILLRDQTVAMRGRCRVTEAKPAPQRATRRIKKIMMRVALLEMDEPSRAVHAAESRCAARRCRCRFRPRRRRRRRSSRRGKVGKKKNF